MPIVKSVEVLTYTEGYVIGRGEECVHGVHLGLLGGHEEEMGDVGQVVRDRARESAGGTMIAD